MLWGLCCVFFYVDVGVCLVRLYFYGLFCIVDGCGSVFVFVFLV